MARRRLSDRLPALISAATQVFASQGYRRTQMADVARQLGVAPGTLYLYAEGKEALFDLVVRHGLELGGQSTAPELPVRTPPPGGTLEWLRSTLEQQGKFTTLTAALRKTRVRDPRAELKGIVAEVYGRMLKNRWGLILLARSAQDWPELAAVFLGGLRHRVIQQLAVYLDLRMAAGQLRRTDSGGVNTAIFVTETLAWWVLHRMGDAGYPHIPDRVAETLVTDLIVSALVKP